MNASTIRGPEEPVPAVKSRNAVCLCTDRRMLVPALFVADSVSTKCEGAPRPFEIVVLAEQADITSAERDWMDHRGICFHEFNRAPLRDLAIINQRLSVATLVKLILAEELAEQYDKILYLDADLTVHEDLASIFTLDTGEAPIAAQLRARVWSDRNAAVRVKAEEHFEALGMTRPFRYFNSGVLYIDVPKWLARDLTWRSLDFIKSHREICHLPDEDALNGVLDGHFASLSPLWNMLPPRRGYSDLTEYAAPTIVHHTGPHKPWRRFGYRRDLFPDLSAYRLYVDFLQGSPWPNWLSGQWTPWDLGKNVVWELERAVRRVLGRLDEPTASQLRAYARDFAEFCAEEDFADVEQGLVIRESGKLRLSGSSKR